ncbi:hypothetical protein BPC006_I3523 [Burkholderia pseudomallei BPC006]|nr:hypothetical protein BPC006_I3523 [Burkholderia pseudomallei BPC006]
MRPKGGVVGFGKALFSAMPDGAPATGAPFFIAR